MIEHNGSEGHGQLTHGVVVQFAVRSVRRRVHKTGFGAMSREQFEIALDSGRKKRP